MSACVYFSSKFEIGCKENTFHYINCITINNLFIFQTVGLCVLGLKLPSYGLYRNKNRVCITLDTVTSLKPLK